MSGLASEGPWRVRVLLLRHGQVANHKGDVPLTPTGEAQADAAGRWFADQEIAVATVLSGETLRTRHTADGFVAGYRAAGGDVADPVVSVALRNPDLYLGGHRINMAEGAEALAAQSPAMRAADVERSVFFAGFMTAPDRVAHWLEHPDPPGDDAVGVGRRIDRFAMSLADVPAWEGATVVAVTHSPVLRAVRLNHWNEYSKEPPFLHGYALTVGLDGDLTMTAVATGTGDIPATAAPGTGVGPTPTTTTSAQEASS
ncbi:MAG: histidine phosphatase family protein [Actinomycetota bacterium]